MKHLSKESTAIFLKLIDKMGCEKSKDIVNKSNELLHIETVSDVSGDRFIIGALYKISYQTRTERKWHIDTEMNVILSAEANGNDQQCDIVIPVSLNQNNGEVNEDGIIIENGKISSVNKYTQHGHVNFCNKWFKTFKQQGFLNN